MGMARTLENFKIADIPELKSSTAKLLFTFLKMYFNVPELPFNSAVARCTRIYTEFGQLAGNLSSSNETSVLKSVAREMLEKLQYAAGPAAKSLYDILIREAEPLFKSTADLEAKESLAKGHCNENKDKTFQALAAILAAIAAAPDPKEKAYSQEILNQLSTAEKNRRALQVELEQLKKAQQATNSQLKSIYHRAYEAMPSKVGLPALPAREEEIFKPSPGG
jgi:hypothetical protein